MTEGLVCSRKTAHASPQRPKAKGQSLVIISLSMLFILVCVGLAIDGGSMYMQRRKAQNAADAAALAGTQVMLSAYEAMMGAYITDVDGTALTEDQIRSTIDQVARDNSVDPSMLNAYFVNDSKQIVSVTTGENGACGSAQPCQVGQNGSVPWTRGVKGIAVSGVSNSNAFVMSVVGWDKVSARAVATAFMGPATDINPGVGVLPVGFFTTTVGVQSLQPELTYVLLSGDSRYTSGSWGYVNFNGNGGSASTAQAWLACGYNPSITTDADWDRWCPSYASTQHATGPTEYWLGDTSPDSGPYFAPRLAWGFGTDGWWVPGSTGTTRSNCEDLADIVEETNGGDYLIPIFDNWTGNGNNARFHMAGLGLFHIDNSLVDCHATDPNIYGEYDLWHIEGVYKQQFAAGSSGSHGSMRHNSLHVVFLDP